MSRFHELAFLRYQDLALSIAEECDTLLEEQRELAEFAASLRAFLVDVREMVSLTVATDTGHAVAIPAALFTRITTDLVSMEKSVGLDEVSEESVRAISVAPLLQRRAV